MIARRLPQLLRHPFATVFIAVPLGAFLALLAVAALAVFAGLLGLTAVHDILRDVGVNTGPLAFFGGLGAGLSAWWYGSGFFGDGGARSDGRGALGGRIDEADEPAEPFDLWTELSAAPSEARQWVELAEFHSLRVTDPSTGELMTDTEYLRRKIDHEEADYQADYSRSHGTDGGSTR